MTVISIVGGHNREALAAFLNPLVLQGGIQEIRVLKLGDAELIGNIVCEFSLIHEFEMISAVNLEDFICKDGVFSEVIVFLNSTYQDVEKSSRVAFHLLDAIYSEISKSGGDSSLYLVFGDNMRGLLQKNYLERLAASNKAKTEVHSVALSSIFHISKAFNSLLNSSTFRSYPKADGSFYTYDPSNKMTTEAVSDLSKELESQLAQAERLFTQQSAHSYPNLEGTVLSRFVATYIQKDWNVACSDEGMYSRFPSRSECEYYDLADSSVAVFLPPATEDDDGDDGSEILPELVKRHVKEAGDFVLRMIKKCDN